MAWQENDCVLFGGLVDGARDACFFGAFGWIIWSFYGRLIYAGSMKKCARPVERPKVGRVMGNPDFCTWKAMMRIHGLFIGALVFTS